MIFFFCHIRNLNFAPRSRNKVARGLAGVRFIYFNYVVWMSNPEVKGCWKVIV